MAWEDFFSAGEDIAHQLLVWQVLAQIVGNLTAPSLDYLTQLVNASAPLVPISPPILADMVVRGEMDQATAAGMAALSGISGENFARLVVNTGQAPDTTMLVEAFRRKIIPQTGTGGGAVSLEEGIRQGHLADKWIPMILALGDVPLSPADAVDAVVENQIPHDQGAAIAYQNGLSAENFAILVNTRGNPPSPTELFDLNRRGLIPMTGTGPDVLSVEQGLSESALKDKWIKTFSDLSVVLPPAGTIRTMLAQGTITDAQALIMLQQIGEDQQTAALEIADAANSRTATDRELTASNIVALYADRGIDAATAISMLGALHYSAEVAQYKLDLADLQKATTALNQAISKLRTLYLGYKIDRTTVVNDLGVLGVPASQRDDLIQTWDLELGAEVKLLTAAEITDAWYYLIIDANTALQLLVDIGYTASDAWIVLSIKNKGPLDTPQPTGLTLPAATT